MAAKRRKTPCNFDPRLVWMALAASNYRSLRQIVGEWAAQSGELLPVTLRRICDWAICGAFPERTFVFPTGQAVDLLELHRAMRIVTKAGAPINEEVAFDLLRVAVVSNSGIEDYCRRFGVDPPSTAGTLRSGVRRLFGKPLHLAPPDCPNSVEIVAQLEAICFATGAMNTMKSLLEQARSYPKFPISEKQDERWLCYVNLAQPSVESSNALKIRSEFEALQNEWKELRENLKEAASSDENVNSQRTVNTKRGAGRPEGSGSYESEDLKLVEEMREGLLSGKYRSIAAAARDLAERAAGHGTLASKEKRLRTRYAERYPE